MVKKMTDYEIRGWANWVKSGRIPLESLR